RAMNHPGQADVVQVGPLAADEAGVLLALQAPEAVRSLSGGGGKVLDDGHASASIQGFVGTERCHRWMTGKDAGPDAQRRCARRRGRRPAPPGVPRMCTNLGIGALTPPVSWRPRARPPSAPR